MEQYIYYDLIDDETILWSCQGENKASNEKSSISNFLETVMRHSMSITFALLAFFVIYIGMHPRYWGTLLAMAIISAIIFQKTLSYKKEKSQLIYYLTDKRIIILKKYSTKQIVRSQHVVDIEKIEIHMQSDASFNLFFSPMKKIRMYEAKFIDGYQNRQIDVEAPMVFLSAQNIKELLTMLKMQKNIEIYYKAD